MIAVSEVEMRIVLEIVKKHSPGCDVLVFGSRLKGTYSDASDLDLALKGQVKLDLDVIGRIKEDFMESDIPYKVDVLDYNRVSTNFQKIIDAGYEFIYKKDEFL